MLAMFLLLTWYHLITCYIISKTPLKFHCYFKWVWYCFLLILPISLQFLWMELPTVKTTADAGWGHKWKIRTQLSFTALSNFLLVFKITMTSSSVCKGSLNQVLKHCSIILLKVTAESCHCILTLVGWKGNSLQQSWNGEVPHPSNSSATLKQEVRLNGLQQLKRSTFPQRNMFLLNSFYCFWSFYSDLMLKLDLLISVLQVSLEFVAQYCRFQWCVVTFNPLRNRKVAWRVSFCWFSLFPILAKADGMLFL